MAVDSSRSGEDFMSSSSDGRPSPFTQQQQQQQTPQRYKFTPDELRVLRECNRESFYFRSLPLGTALGVGTYYAVKSGYLSPSVRFGAGPKTFAASLFGYFIGKMSYQSKCVEKIMNLPNSPLADVLRRQKGKLGFQETLSMEPGFVTAAPIVASVFPESDHGHHGPQEPGSFTDVGDTRPMTSFDTESSNFTAVDNTKYDTTQEMLDDNNLPEKKPQFFTSYDELRKQNREEFENRPSGSMGMGSIYSGSAESQGPNRVTPPPQQKPARAIPEAKNIYGDVWDDKPQ